jgi:hypothetical protein
MSALMSSAKEPTFASGGCLPHQMSAHNGIVRVPRKPIRLLVGTRRTAHG